MCILHIVKEALHFCPVSIKKSLSVDLPQFLLILSILSMFQLHLIFQLYNVQSYDNKMLVYFMPIIFRHLSQILVILLMLCISHIVAEVVRH